MLNQSEVTHDTRCTAGRASRPDRLDLILLDRVSVSTERIRLSRTSLISDSHELLVVVLYPVGERDFFDLERGDSIHIDVLRTRDRYSQQSLMKRGLVV